MRDRVINLLAVIIDNKFYSRRCYKADIFLYRFFDGSVSLNESSFNNYNKVWGTVRVNLLLRIPMFLY